MTRMTSPETDKAKKTLRNKFLRVSVHTPHDGVAEMLRIEHRMLELDDKESMLVTRHLANLYGEMGLASTPVTHNDLDENGDRVTSITYTFAQTQANAAGSVADSLEQIYGNRQPAPALKLV